MRIAIIPARGGSRRVRYKNYRDFCGKPMLQYPIECARASGLFDLIVVSTDDEDIAGLAFSSGAVVVPRETDDGTRGTQEVAALTLEKLGIRGGLCCVIYATTPLLLPQDLNDGYKQLLLPHHAHFAMSVGPDGQDAGAYYWGWVRAFLDRSPLEGGLTHRVPLPAERVCDINEWSDFHRAESMFNALRRAP